MTFVVIESRAAYRRGLLVGIVATGLGTLFLLLALG